MSYTFIHTHAQAHTNEITSVLVISYYNINGLEYEETIFDVYMILLSFIYFPTAFITYMSLFAIKLIKVLSGSFTEKVCLSIRLLYKRDL